MSELIPLNKALEFLLGEVTENTSAIEVAIPDALGCVLAEDQLAAINVPNFDNSAMDGYALRTEDLGEPGCVLPVSQSIAAGHPGVALEEGTAARIFTGAPLPAGADAVVIQENTRVQDGGIAIMEIPAKGANIRGKGHDILKGGTVLDAGQRLRPQDLGMLASLGIDKVKIKKPLQVAIINTGDEVIAPDKDLQPGQIHDSNSFTLEGLLKDMGMTVLKLGVVADTLEDTEHAIKEAAGKADCIITTGGVSVGDEDHVRNAVENLGQLALWKLAIKPGKPFSFGHVQDIPFFGLPGNPVAVFVTFVMLVAPFLLKTQGANKLSPLHVNVKAGFEHSVPGSRLEFIRVRLVTTDAGDQELEAFANQGSSIMTSLSWADGLAEIPLGEAVKKGQWLKFYPFRGIL